MIRGLMFGAPANIPPLLVVILAIWSIFWKGIALWRSAKNNQRYWFIAILILSTAGILEIAYLWFFQREQNVTT